MINILFPVKKKGGFDLDSKWVRSLMGPSRDVPGLMNSFEFLRPVEAFINRGKDFVAVRLFPVAVKKMPARKIDRSQGGGRERRKE